MRIPDDDLSRRQFIKLAGAFGATGFGMLALGACSNDGDKEQARGASPTKGFAGGGDTLKVGLVGVFSGPGAFVGRIIDNSIDAAVQQINATGGVGGRKVEVIKRDTGTDPAAGVRAYQEFAGNRDVVGVLWAGAGLDESLGQIDRDGMPVVSVFVDLYSDGNLYPDNKAHRSVFQLAMPDQMALDQVAAYCKNDRGYRKVAFVHDGLVYADIKRQWDASLKKAGLTSGGIETYQLNDSDFGPQLGRLRSQRPEAVVIWGLAGDTAGIVKQLDRLGAAYIDTPTAKAGGAWHPHILGSPGGTGEHTWADLAGGAAKAGTLTVWHIGGLVYLPSFQIRDYIKKHLNKTVTGGEESPADGLYALLKGVEKAGTTDRQRVVQGIETMGKVKFASIEFGFSADRHLAKTPDDLNMVTLERSTGPAPTDPPYQLGTEWREHFAAGYVGPTHLVRPTLEANRRAHPEVIAEVLQRGYGTQCTKLPDGTLSNACKIH